MKWHQTFLVWLKEAEWSRNGYTPSIKEYIEVATSSIATQTIVLPASLLLSSAPPLLEALEFPQAETVTHLLMILTRLLNDSQSYKVRTCNIYNNNSPIKDLIVLLLDF